MDLALRELDRLRHPMQRLFARCGILGAAQWAFDCREQIPSAHEFRCRLKQHLHGMIVGARDYLQVCNVSKQPGLFASCFHRSVIGIEEDFRITRMGAPSLVLTSPPYPGVHVLYHRWQVRGRRETPAPFWIAGAWDGHGESYYTFGSRKEPRLSQYFSTALSSFESISRIINRNTIVVQMVAFANPQWQFAVVSQDDGGSRVRGSIPQISHA